MRTMISYVRLSELDILWIIYYLFDDGRDSTRFGALGELGVRSLKESEDAEQVVR